MIEQLERILAMNVPNKMLREFMTIKGSFGPIDTKGQDLVFAIKPLTVLIGPQGSGKSLVSQLLYFLRDAEYLLNKYSETDQPVRDVVDQLRASGEKARDLASFVRKGNVRVSYDAEYSEPERILTREMSISANHRILALKTFTQEIEKWFEEWKLTSKKPSSKAIFIPAERTLFSRFYNTKPSILGDAVLPLPLREFSDVLFPRLEYLAQWELHPETTPPEVRRIHAITGNALRGQVKLSRAGRLGRDKLQWVPENSNKPLELEMASSGQMEAWPMIFTAQSIFSLRSEERPLFLHIEEPEAHLHPDAQQKMVEMLAYLVKNCNVRIVITTHSLNILYAVNNLIMAYQKLKEEDIEVNEKTKFLPPADLRLPPEMVNAYFMDGQSVECVFDEETAQLDETRLGEWLAKLERQFNYINSYKSMWS